MRKCDQCKNDPVCRGVFRSECIVRDYRNFVLLQDDKAKRCCRTKVPLYEDAITSKERCNSCLRRYGCDTQTEFECKHNNYNMYCVDLTKHGHWEALYVCSQCGGQVRIIEKECPFCHSIMDGEDL